MDDDGDDGDGGEQPEEDGRHYGGRMVRKLSSLSGHERWYEAAR